MPDCKPFSLLCTKNFLALAGAFLVTIAQGGAAYPGDCAECSVRRMSAVPGGVACPLCRRLTLPLAYFYAPYPPSPLPQRGRGCPKVYFAGGFAPGTPALDLLRHLQNLPNRCQAGGLPSLSPACPAFSFLFCPLSPQPPSPVGKGEIKVIFMQGAAPLASPRLNPRGTYRDCQAGTQRKGKSTVFRQNGRKCFPLSSAGSQGEGGPGERNFGV